MKDAVEYKGILLMKGSYAYELFHLKEDKSHIMLDRHLKELDQIEKDLKDRYGVLAKNN